MAINTLYNYLQSMGPFPVRMPKGNSLVLTKNSEGKSYFRVDIANTAGISFLDGTNTYTLTEHHISVYEKENRDVAQLSQYHYTAYFIDNEGLRYQLHVYFNENEILTTAPVFSKLSASGDSLRISADALYFDFIGLTNSICAPVVSTFHLELKEKIKDLEKQYKALEREACEILKGVTDDYSAYQGKLDQACAVLAELSPLVWHNHYQKCYEFIQQIKKSVRQPKKVAVEKTELLAESTHSDVPASAAGLVARPRSQSPVIMKDAEIAALCARFTELSSKKTEAEEEYTKGLVDILNEVYSLSFELAENRGSTSTNSILELQKLHSTLNAAAEKLYVTFLIAQNNLISELKSFNYLISPKFLYLALQTKNTVLLDFILKNGAFDLSTQEVVVEKKSYSTAVRYCYENMDADCLRILIEYNASLLDPDKEGFPIAYKILSTAEHPLKNVLFDPSVSTKVVDSISFYKQLIAALTDCIRKPDLDSTVRDSIKADIIVYNRKIDGLRHLSHGASGSACKKAVNDLEIKFGTELYIERLKHDAYYNELADRLKRRTHDYLKTLVKSEQRAFERQSRDYMGTLAETLSKADISSLTFEAAKNEACAYLNKCLDVIEYRIELQKLNQQLSGVKGSLSKRLKKMDKRRAELIGLIESDSSEPQNSAVDTEFADALNQLTQVMGFANIALRGLQMSLSAQEESPSSATEEGIKRSVDAALDTGFFAVDFKPKSDADYPKLEGSKPK